MGKVLAILRAEQFSPNSVERDRAVMMAVVERIRSRGHRVEVVCEDQLPRLGVVCEDQLPGLGTWKPETVLTMGRLPETLSWLKALGVRVVNSPDGVARCQRSVLEGIMRSAGVPMPPRQGSDGYWLKRGDTAAQTERDVVYAADEKELEHAIDVFRRRGIDNYTVSAHVVGDVVKFYGVLPPLGAAGFFRCYYPADDGLSKFGDERRNGPANHYPFSRGDLRRVAERLAVAVGVEVYGGDCIVRPDGTFCVIDFNDWPSFSRCRDEAAEAIVRKIES